MNREQAEHILDAYTMMARASMESQEEADAKHALREVILDAMTNCNVTTPSIIWPNTQPFTVPTYKPIVTCDTGGGTCRITASSTDGLCSDNPRQYFELSCGHSFTLDGLGAPVACSVCGEAVER